MKVLTIDFETRSSTDLKAKGAKNYLDDVDFKIIIMAYKIDDQPTVTVDFPDGDFMEDLLAQAEHDKAVIVAHNAKFELGALKEYYLAPPLEMIRDTMVMCQYYGIPASLADATKFLNIKSQKLTLGKGLIDLFTKPIPEKVKERLGVPEDKIFWEPEDKPMEWEQFKEYAKVDVDGAYEIYKMLPPVPDHIWYEWEVNYMINNRGVKVDIDFVLQAVEDLTNEQEEALTELQQLTGLDNPRSNAQMKDWLSTFCGITVDSLNKDSIASLIDSVESPFVKRVLITYSKLTKTSGAKYQKFLDLTDNQGYLYYILNYYGAHTGRWSSWGVQLHNMKRIDLPDYAQLRDMAVAGILPLVAENVTEVYTNLIRTALVSRNKKKLVVVDFSQIEARVLQWLAQDEEALAVFASDKDFYTYTAANMFKKKYEDIDKKSPERRKGKIATLALGYGGGPRALERSAEGTMSEYEKQELVQLWRKANARVVTFWAKLNNAFSAAASAHKTTVIHVGKKDKLEIGWILLAGKSTVYITLPSKRSIYFPDIRVVDGNYAFYGKASDEQFGTDYVKVYGGFLAENVTQAIARDCLEILIERLTTEGIPVAFHVHDEVVCEVDDAFPLQRIVDLAKETIYQGLPLASEPAEGKYYDK